MIALLLLGGCNRYDLFLVGGGDDRRANDADVLFVIDNSDSMVEESVALAENFAGFVERLAGREADYGTDGLADAVDRYKDYVQDPGYFVDFQLAITTTDATNDRGRLIGDPPILRKGDPDLEEKFIENLMCDATCFGGPQAAPDDPDYTCDQGWTGKISRQFLDCLCGEGAWIGHCGSGAEEGLEAVFDAMCRATDDPPEGCTEGERVTLRPQDLGTNEGLLRDGATMVPVIISDEGDSSRRVPGNEALPLVYFQLFGEFDRFMSWAAVAPGLTQELEIRCDEHALAKASEVLHYVYLVQESGGLYEEILTESCEEQDWGATLDRLGDLVGGGVGAFPLSSVPVEGSIAVEVGHRNIPPSEPMGADAFGQPIWGDGWTWRAEDNTVLLHGSAIPAPGDEVRIWFWPVQQ